MRVLVSCLFCLAAYFSAAQQYNFLTYSVEEGLTQNQVYGIVQDKKGYLWFGTTAGLSRFDGNTFKNFSQRDGLYRNQVNDLFISKDGTIWVATIGGFSIYKDNKFTPISLGKNYDAVRINSIEERQDGSIWLGTSGRGIIVYKDGVVSSFDKNQELLHSTVRCIYEDISGTLWIATKLGVNYIKDGKIHTLDHPELLNASISHVTGDDSGGIWISTFGKGVCFVKNNNLLQLTTKEGLETDWIKQAIVDGNTVWLCSKFGFHEIKGNQVAHTFSKKNGLPYNDIKCMLIDNEGNLWLGSNGIGAIKFSGKAFVNYTTADGLSDNIILSIDQDKNGNLWLGSYNKGLMIFDPKKERVIKQISNASQDNGNTIASSRVWSGIVTQDNTIWIGTEAGLNQYKDSIIKTFRSNTSESRLNSDKIISVFNSKDGKIWCGTRAGLSLYISDSTFRNYTAKDGFEGVNIRTIIEDKEGYLWCGADNGLFRFDPKTEQGYRVTIGSDINEVKVLSLVIDNSNRFWVGTDNGLYLKTNTGYNYISTGQDVRSNFVNFLLADQGVLWIGTNYGVYALTYLSENDYRVRAFTNHEGIKNLECNLNAAFKDDSGHYWFGTAGGLVKLDKKLLKNESSTKNNVTIRSIELFNETTDWSRYSKVDERSGLPINLELGHSKNTLSFDFILFNYSNPENVVYTYTLEGYDEGWSPNTTESSVVYRKLPPGDYVFKVKAITSNGSWTDITSFNFSIHPPFWQTAWFFSLITLGLICMIIAIFVWRKTVNKRKRDTEQLIYRNKLLALEHQSLNASLNRHFIFNALNSIQYYINRQDRISANKYLSSFAKLIRKNLDSSSSQSNYVSLAEEIERTELYLSLEHMRFSNKFEYEIVYEEPIETESIMLPAMMLQPFIENSIWHGILPMERLGKITLTLGKTINGDLKFDITDNGMGIDESKARKKKSGNSHDSKGMMITSGRIDLLKTITRRNISLKGPYQIHHPDGSSAGTRVEITIPTNTMETFL